MDKQQLIEALAALAHDQWSGWMIYVFDLSLANDDGSVIIPAEHAQRWTRQIVTPYADLSAIEQDSDRREAARVLAVLHEHNIL